MSGLLDMTGWLQSVVPTKLKPEMVFSPYFSPRDESLNVSLPLNLLRAILPRQGQCGRSLITVPPGKPHSLAPAEDAKILKIPLVIDSRKMTRMAHKLSTRKDVASGAVQGSEGLPQTVASCLVTFKQRKYLSYVSREDFWIKRKCRDKNL